MTTIPPRRSAPSSGVSDNHGADAPGTPLTRFAEHLDSIGTAAARSLCRIPAARSEREREAYLGSWQRAELLAQNTRLAPGAAATLAAVIDAGQELGRHSANNPGDRRVALLALGVARALALREELGERDFLTLTTEWRRVMGPNSLR
jgi:hypothetical protein